MIDCNFVNLDSISQPITGVSPVGEDPRHDVSPNSLYYQLKDQRRALRDKERLALTNDEISLPTPGEWAQLAEDITSALTLNAKDLEYGAWLIESLCRCSGFTGLSIAFDSVRCLIENYWDAIFPLPDEDGLETRIAPLVGLNGYDGDGVLISPILTIPLVICNTERNFATWQYMRARDQSRKEENKKNQSGRVLNLDDIVQMIAETPSEYFVSLLTEIDKAINSFTLLAAAMDAAMQGQPQPTSAILKALNHCKDTVNYLTRDKLQAFHAENEAASEVNSSVDEDNGEQVAPVAKQAQTREQVLKSLQEAAVYFRKTEPHSPISYALEQVVHWSGLSLPELLKELIDDNNSRNQFFRLTGINKNSES